MFLSTTLGVLGHHSAWHAVVAMWQLPLQHTMFGANAVLKAAVKGYRWQAGLFLLRTPLTSGFTANLVTPWNLVPHLCIAFQDSSTEVLAM